MKIDYRTAAGATGDGQAYPLTSDSGYFWFFDDANVELVIKVIDGCGYNGRYWVFAGGLTFLVLSFLIYAPGTVLYVKTRREQGKQLFAPAEWFAFAVVVAGALYALLIEGAITREIHPRRALPRVLVKGGRLVGGVLVLLASAMGLTSWLVDAQVPDRLLAFVQANVDSRILFLLSLNLFLLVLGSVLEVYSAIVVLTPLVIPLGAAFGIDPLHLGVIFLANLELGYLFPPVGLNLFVFRATAGNISVATISRGLIPFIVALVLAAAHQGERLAPMQFGGLLVAFGSIAMAFGEGAVGGSWKGDLMILGAALLWGLTTVTIRLSALRSASSEVTLAYQLGVAAVLSPIAAVVPSR